MTNKNPIAIEKRHYAIRKLTIGAASVLIGLTFASGSSQLVKADSVQPVQIKQAKAPLSNQSTAKEPAGTLIVKTVEHTKASSNAQLVSPATDKNALPKKAADEKSESLKKAASNQANSLNAQKVSSDTQKSALPKGEAYKDKKDQKKQSKDQTKSFLSVKKEESTFQPQKDAKPISKRALKAEKFRALPTRVSNADEFEQAVVRAPTDDSQTDIELIHDIDLGADRLIVQSGQNIVITNDDRQRKLMIGNQIKVADGGKLTIQGRQKNGIIITRPAGTNPANPPLVTDKPDYTGWENYWNVLQAEGSNAELNLTNVEVTGFHFVYATFGELNDISKNWRENGVIVHRSLRDELNDCAGGDRFAYANQYTGLILLRTGSHGHFKGVKIDHNLIYDYDDQYNARYVNDPYIGVGTIFVGEGSSCDMDAATTVSYNEVGPENYLSKAKTLSDAYAAGGVLVMGGTLTANGTIFDHNKGISGAICAFDQPDLLFSNTINFHGAKLTNNHAYYAGGAMYLRGGAAYGTKLRVLIDKDTKIIGNTAGDVDLSMADYLHQIWSGTTNGFGGGIAASDGVLGYPSQYDTVTDPTTGRTFRVIKPVWRRAAEASVSQIIDLTIDDADISNNTALTVGGGLYVDTNGVKIKKAVISNNAAKYSMGGGIYISVVPYALKLNNAVIHDNYAKKLTTPAGDDYDFPFDNDDHDYAGSGGGIWLCPTGSVKIKITDGIAVYDNTADMGGADFWNERKYQATAWVYDRALGGSDANWTYDYRQANSSMDSHDGQAFVGPQVPDNTGLKSNLTQDAKDFAQALAQVEIFGNVALFGGGIGGNGGLETYSGNEPASRVKDITITKQWDDNNDPNRPASVTIKVMAKDPADPSRQFEVTHFELTAADHWTYELKNLPTDIDYAFTEVAIDQNHDGQPDYSESQGTLTPVHPAGAATDVDYYTLILTNKKNQPKTAEIKIVKHWANADDPDRPGSIKFDIYDAETGKKVSSLVLSARDADASGDWVGTVKGLNDSKTYRVEEEKIDENHDGESDYQVTAGKLTHVASTDASVDLWEIDFTNTLNNNPSPNPSPSVTRTIRIIKHWDDGDAKRPAVIRFDLYRLVHGQRQYVQTITLTSADADADGDWVGEISDLPDGDQYELAEEMIDENHDGISDYRVEEGQMQQLASGDSLVDLWQIVFVNSKEPTPTPTPTPEPNPIPVPVPTPTPTPEPNPTPGRKPRKGTTGKVVKISKHHALVSKMIKKPENRGKASKQLPQTGDQANIFAAVGSMIIGLLGFGLADRKRRR